MGRSRMGSGWRVRSDPSCLEEGSQRRKELKLKESRLLQLSFSFSQLFHLDAHHHRRS